MYIPPILKDYKFRKVAINEGQDNEIVAMIKEVDENGMILEVLISKKPYLTGFTEKSLKYISHSTSIAFTILP